MGNDAGTARTKRSAKPRYALVVLPNALRQAFTYSVRPEHRDTLELGHRVLVPFGRSRAHGYVVGWTAERPNVPAIKSIASIEPEEVLFSEDILALTRWVADYYLAPWGLVLEGAVPPLVRKSGSIGRRRRAGTADADVVPTVAPELSVIAAGPFQDSATLDRESPAPGPVDKEARDEPGATWSGEAHLDDVRSEAPLSEVTSSVSVLTDAAAVTGSPTLFPEQATAVGALEQALAHRKFQAFLLHGVTGSGKTEVYLRAAARTLAEGGQVLFLVPEIGLSTQILARVKQRFPGQVGLYHSQVAEGERRDVWARARRGELPIVLGARSAVFVPMPDLRLVIVDEEHESSYKQDESPRYHGRDVALFRAQRARAVAVLGTATPSLEMRANVERGKLSLLELTERIDGRPRARVHLVDMGEVARQIAGDTIESSPAEGSSRRPRAASGAGRQGFAAAGRVRLGAGVPILSPYLVRMVQDRLDREEQVILFLNRRGHSTTVQCGFCGAAVQCGQCDVVMTYHRAEELLRCHYCNAFSRVPAHCESCHGAYFLFGGYGTQRVEEALHEHFPRARIARMDRDTTRKRGAHGKIVEEMEGGHIDILLGTQMVAKGFDFHGVTLVGVIQADQELFLPDYRAGERGFQILTQVAGRAGRGETRGEVVFQTLMPEQYAIAAAAQQDYRIFAEKELVYRQELGYPPFRRMVHLLVDGRKEDKVQERSAWLANLMLGQIEKDRSKVEVLGPAPMPISRLKGQFRWHLSLLSKSREALHHLGLLALETKAPAGLSGTRVQVDVDPMGML